MQFENKVYNLSDIEYQTFFQKIMKASDPRFESIRPYGNIGDGGNDGYIEEDGVYYQVYSPLEPREKEAASAKKFTDDFYKLKEKWDPFCSIQEYNFVFNNKGRAITPVLEKARLKLKSENPLITFKIFKVDDLKEKVFKLSEDSLLSIGFNVDRRVSVQIINSQLSNIHNHILTDEIAFAQIILTHLRPLVEAYNINSLPEIRIIESILLIKNEKHNEAIKNLQIITEAYPDDIRPKLYLAGIYLDQGNYKQNNKLLQEVVNLDTSHWQYEYELLRRKLHLSENIDLIGIPDKIATYNNPLVYSVFYSLYAEFAVKANDFELALALISKAIFYNPNKKLYEYCKIAINYRKICLEADSVTRDQLVFKIKKFIEDLDLLSEQNSFANRTVMAINFLKFQGYLFLRDGERSELCLKHLLDSLFECSFDKSIDSMLIEIFNIWNVSLDQEEQICKYLSSSGIPISAQLSDKLFILFICNNTLLTSGKKFFKTLHIDFAFELIECLEAKNYQPILDYFKHNTFLLFNLACHLKDFPDLRLKLINEVTNNSIKSRLLVIYHLDLEEHDLAFSELKKIEFKNLGFRECVTFLELVRNKNAFEFEIEILNKLIEFEPDASNIWYIKLDIIFMYNKMKEYHKVSELGVSLLSNYPNSIQNEHLEGLLRVTINSFLERRNTAKALEVLEDYSAKFKLSTTFILEVKSLVYLNNNLPEKALNSLIEGFKLINTITEKEYSKYFDLLVKLSKFVDTSTLDIVGNNCFIKINNNSDWFFIGDGQHLDATPIGENHHLYRKLKNARLNSEVSLSPLQSKSKETIELIYSYEQYIPWKISHSFRSRCAGGHIEHAFMIEAPKVGDNYDFSDMFSLLKQDAEHRDALFEAYASSLMPLAFLARQQGGLIEAIRKIAGSTTTYINCSSGAASDMMKQRRVANQVVNKAHCYLDTTSAIFLILSGIFPKVFNNISNIRFTSSLLTYLYLLLNNVSDHPWTEGKAIFQDGRFIFYRPGDEDDKALEKSLRESINLLEAHPFRVDPISPPNRIVIFKEVDLPPELIDASSLAFSRGCSIITEDPLLLFTYSAVSQNSIPEFCSSIDIVKTLYNSKVISYSELLDYHYLLSTFRVKFLSVEVGDLHKCIYGDDTNINKLPAIDNIKKLNLKLVFSEKYGVSQEAVIRFLFEFFMGIIFDCSKDIYSVKKIIKEIQLQLPDNIDSKKLMQFLPQICNEKTHEITNKVYYPEYETIRARADIIFKKKNVKRQNIAIK